MTEILPTEITQAKIRANYALTHSIFRMEIEAPAIASQIRPGQFVMIRPSFGNDPLLGRPLAVYDALKGPESQQIDTISVVYQVFGRGTGRLSQLQTGEDVRLWGPLGHAFDPDPMASRIWLVAGGIGYTPFLALGKWWLGTSDYGGISTEKSQPPVVEFLYGARSGSLLPPLEEFKQAGFTVEICTDDGSVGHHGRVTELMSHKLNNGREPNPDLIVACGPEAMLAAVSRWSESKNIRCLVSLENQMACGFGACFSCVAPIRQSDGSVDLRRVCLEGPIFDAQRVAWQD